MLSLSPRYDLFRFNLPVQFLPVEVKEKWSKVLNKEPGVLANPVDYLNESIKGINLPGISDTIVNQQQGSSNTLSGVNREPTHDNSYYTPANPLSLIDRTFKITFRLNQGLYNYFMIYETLFYRICKPIQYSDGDDFSIELLDEDGAVRSKLMLYQCHISGIDGLDFSFDKQTRDADTFECSFNFNNIDFDIV